MITEGDGSTAQIQEITLPDASLFTSSGSGDYFFIYSGGGTQYYAWYNVDSGNSDPSPGGTAISIAISSSDSSTSVATDTVTAITALSDFTAVTVLANYIRITNAAVGDSTSIQPITMPITSISNISYNKTESTMSITNGAGIGTYSIMRSNRGNKYRPGQGGIGRFTAIFDTPTTGIQQIAGVGNLCCGFFFGVNPADGEFGILHRKTGLPAVYKLTIDTAPNAGQIATITLDGIDFEVTLSSSTAQVAAYDITIASNTFLPGQWLLEQIDNTVTFFSETVVGTRSINSYSFSSTGNATGTFTTISEGITVENEWISQHNWNQNKLNGYEISKMNFNPTKGNVFQIQYQWLGFGIIKFLIEDNITGAFVPVHSIRYANKHILPSITQPALKLLWSVNATTVASSGTMQMASGGLFNEGIIKDFDNNFSLSESHTTSSSSEEHILTIKNRQTFYGKTNNAVIKPKFLSFINDANKGGIIKVYSGTILTDYNYQYVNEIKSVSVFDISGTISSGTEIFTAGIAKGSTVEVNLSNFENLFLQQNETLTFTITRVTNTNVEVSATMVWHEDQ
jgi:hypothetical protein